MFFHSMIDNAPVGQAAEHSPQRMHLPDLCVSLLTVAIDHGQEEVQAEQPRQRSVSTLMALYVSFHRMAPTGQAPMQAGSLH
jgi:hypothetical protein